MTTETTEHDFQLNPDARIYIKNITGLITIRPSADDVMRIRAD